VSAEGFMRARAMAHRSYENSVLHALHCWVLAVLHFDPILRPSCAIGSVFAFRDQALEAELAGLAEENLSQQPRPRVILE
jgi:hypothetical protein